MSASPIRSPEASPQGQAAPRWLPWVIGLTPVFPPLYLTAFGGLRALRGLPMLARWVLLFFAVTQLAAAVFTPRPLVSLGLAALRVLFVLAMISAGVWLRDSRRLRPLVWGYTVVFGTAWLYTLATLGLSGIQGRLGHPYYYIVSLGLLGAICLWLVVSWRGASPWWRIPVGALAAVTMVATGSRGPLLAFVVGIVAATLNGGRHFLRLLIPLLLIGVAAFGLVPQLRAVNPLERLATGGLTGRDEVWQNAWDAFQFNPVGGSGPYQLGPYLTFLYKDGCTLNPVLEKNGIHCPAWLRPYTGAWLIAHNAALHVLAETGVLGALGYLALFLLGAWRTWQSRDSLLVAVFWGYTAMNTVDVVIAVPSPHFAELAWVVLGLSLVGMNGEAGGAPADPTRKPPPAATPAPGSAAG